MPKKEIRRISPNLFRSSSQPILCKTQIQPPFPLEESLYFFYSCYTQLYSWPFTSVKQLDRVRVNQFNYQDKKLKTKWDDNHEADSEEKMYSTVATIEGSWSQSFFFFFHTVEENFCTKYELICIHTWQEINELRTML